MARRWGAGVLAAAATAAMLAACTRVQVAEAMRGPAPAVAEGGAVEAGAAAVSPEDRGAWPARWGDEAAGLWREKGVIVPVEVRLADLRSAWLGPAAQLRTDEVDLVDAAALAAGRAGEAGFDFRLEGPGGFVFVDGRARDGRVEEGAEGDEPLSPLAMEREPAAMFKFVSGRVVSGGEAAGAAPVGRASVELQRTWFAYYDHLLDRGAGEGAGDGGRGLVVVLPGLFGVPEGVVTAVTQDLRRGGWNVLRALAPPSRFTESTDVWLLPDAAGGEDGTREAAAEITDRMAEYAYAARAARRHVVTALRPGLAASPAVLYAMSGAAISGPTIAAWDPGAYAAAVLVAGGGDAFTIAALSSYSPAVRAVRLAVGPKPADPVEARDRARGRQSVDEDQYEAFVASYLAQAPLDPLRTAPSLRGVPVLMIHGSADEAVPAKAGDALWRALGQPERWVSPIGHEIMFATLWTRTPRVMAWLGARLGLEGDAVGAGGGPVVGAGVGSGVGSGGEAGR